MSKAQNDKALYARDLAPDTHTRLRRAALWVGMSMKDFLAMAIELAIEKHNVPSEILTTSKPSSESQSENA
jgi:hypothetical protein